MDPTRSVPVADAPDGTPRWASTPASVATTGRHDAALPRFLERVVGVWAHPDDESYLAAGLMDRIVGAGGRVTLLTLTDGEGGFAQDDPRSTGERRNHRRQELRAAMGAIGVDDVRFLGIPDGSLGDATPVLVVAAIVAVIQEVRPDAVLTFGPDGITGHDDHVATWRYATAAWSASPSGQLWYAAKSDAWLEQWRWLHEEFDVWMTEEPTGVGPDELGLVVDLDGGDLERKRAVLAAHASQTEALVAAFGEDRYRDWIREETFRRPTGAELAMFATGPTGVDVPAGRAGPDEAVA